MAHRFLNGLEAAAATEGCHDGAGCHDESLWLLRDELEDRLMSRIHSEVFGSLPGEADEDDRLQRQLSSLAATDPVALGVSADFTDTRFNRWDAAAAELREMYRYTTPRSKMGCVMRFVHQLKHGLLECKAVSSGRGEAPQLGADELFPVLVYVVLISNPSQLYSNIQFVQRFRSPMGLKSEAGCYFTHLQAASCFLSSFAEGGGPQGPPPDGADQDSDWGLTGFDSECSTLSPQGSTFSRARNNSTGTMSLVGGDVRQRTATLLSDAVDAWERQVESTLGDFEGGASATPRHSVDWDSDTDTGPATEPRQHAPPVAARFPISRYF
uniref:VPS9 domain-containing protein n=1 Tax=Haptolina ericina TaxID=156174 RepID=A0A7S3B8T3_9EUKA